MILTKEKKYLEKYVADKKKSFFFIATTVSVVGLSQRADRFGHCTIPVGTFYR